MIDRFVAAPANVAVILTRYDQDEQTVVSGILHDVIEDCVRDGYTRATLEQRMGDKFGQDVLDTVLAVTQRQVDEEGIELSSEERKDDYLARLAAAPERGRWVCAADKIHNASTILADLNRTLDPDTVWSRFAVGRSGTVRWYRRVYERLRELGFEAPIMDELREVAADLERVASTGSLTSR